MRYRKRNPVHGLKGSALHVSKEQADQIRATRKALDEVKFVNPEIHISFADAAKEAGLRYETFEKRLTPDEVALARDMRKSAKAQPGKYFVRAEIAPIIERVKPQKLPPHLVHADIYDRRVKSLRTRVKGWLEGLGQTATMVHIEGTSRETPCLTWQQLRLAEETFATHPNNARIDWDMVVRDKFDMDAKRTTYSRMVQALYVDQSLLAELKPAEKPKPTPETETPKQEESEEPATQAPDKELETPAMSRNPSFTSSGNDETEGTQSLTYRDRRAMVLAARPPKATKPRPAHPRTAEQSQQPMQPKTAIAAAQTQQAPTNQVPSKKPRIPSHYINISEYLRGQNAACTPNVLKGLAKQQKLQPVVPDEKNEIWGTNVTGLRLEEIITHFAVADAVMQRPADIAAKYGRYGIEPKHIAHAASGEVSSLVGHVFNRRARLPDGSIGPLDIHYGQTLSRLVIEKIDSLIETGQIGRLLRFAKNL